MHYVAVHHIPEYPGAGRLGRHVWHDSRSRSYPFDAAKVTIRTVTWARMIAILDQGNLGSCTGNAMTGGLGTTPVYEALPASHPTLNEAEAVKLYSAATSLDSYPGSYPPDDTGSDGLSVCKAAQQAGMLSGYTHCFDLNTALAALSAGPVLFGINWYDSFDSPASSGLVAISPNASVRGGHEIVARGLDTDTKLIYLDNSWGTGWGNEGSFSMSWDTMARLLGEDGDATVPVPVTQPAPTPTPTPTPPTPPGPSPDSADVALWQGTQQWATGKHYTKSTKNVAADLKTWAAAKGFYGG